MGSRFGTARRLGAGAASCVLAAMGLAVYAQSPVGLSPSLVRLSENVLPGIDHVRPLGPADPHQQMTLALALTLPDPAGEQQAIRELYDPRSPRYHQFLSLDQFVKRFGLPGAQRDAVTGWLRDGGIDVLSVSAAGDLVVARGTVAQVEQRFDVSESRYSYQGVDFIANTSGPQVPAAFRVKTVMGLNTWQHASTLLNQNPKVVPSARLSPGGTGQSNCLPNGDCIGTLDVTELWSAYDLPAQYTGAGQKLGILGEGTLGDEQTKGSVIANLRQYEDEHHFPHIPVTIHCVIKNDCGSDTLGSGEWSLDSQSSSGMAPYASQMIFYFAQDLTDAGQSAMVAAWLSDPNGPLQANASFAECEAGPYNSAIYPLPGNVDGNGGVQAPLLPADPVLGLPFLGPTGHQLGDNFEAYLDGTSSSPGAGAHALIMGRSLFAGAGDTGTGCTAIVADGLGPNGIAWEPYPANGYPTGSDYVVSVGGTVLYTNNKQRALEYSWTYSGGGSSPFLPAPSFQQNVSAVNGTCVIGPNGEQADTGMKCRGVPDVAALSGDAVNGFEVVFGGADSASGGTSLSGPLMMGTWARIQQASGLARGLGFADEFYYGIYGDQNRYSHDFTDITTGFNGVGNCGQGPCVAGAGWDYTSGLGVPDAGAIATEIAPKPGHVVAAAPAGPPPAAAKVRAAASGLPNTSGSVPLTWLLFWLPAPLLVLVTGAVRRRVRAALPAV